MADTSTRPTIDFSSLVEVLQEGYQEAAIVQPGPPIEIFAQRAAPTVIFKPLQQTSGKYYYECKTHTGGYMQIGWADQNFKPKITEGKGVGDDAHSWAYDGYRCLKWHDNKKQQYGQKWKADDVIGIAVDVDAAKISFSLNGADLGIAFEGVTFKGGIYPCITLLRGERISLYFGLEGNPFCHKPSSGFVPLTITEDATSADTEFNKFSSHATVISMGLSEGSFSDSFAGEIMVTMMGRGLDYEKKKNALVGAGYDATLIKTELKEFDFASKLTHCDAIGLTRNEVLAIICYTLEKPPVYRYFNSDNRKGYAADGIDFPILWYLLKEACRKTLASFPKTERTKDLYRGTSVPFSASPGQIIRFGAFTSATQSKKVADEFQNQQNTTGTQFVITSKLGAPIKFLSAYPEEEEVLIPPYEAFEVVSVEGTARIFVKSAVPDELVDEYINGGGSVYGMKYLENKLEQLKLD
ncbi:uncharacterized protein [Amphiura filiformis]|uniref:uncharacterized protein n=1 Tax=Amphiura filiformis TaxID=82378 RepID=UPI003B216A37